jgi:hypothetical protein
MSKHFVLALIATVLLAGCAATDSQLRQVSESTTGCKPLPHEPAGVTQYRLGMFDSSWTYTCQDKYWNCYATDTLKDPHCRRVDTHGEAIK